MVQLNVHATPIVAILCLGESNQVATLSDCQNIETGQPEFIKHFVNDLLCQSLNQPAGSKKIYFQLFLSIHSRMYGNQNKTQETWA